MGRLLILVRELLVLATYAMTGADYPPIHADLSTPVQQHLAAIGPKGECTELVAPPLSALFFSP
jgi:hypothetical protein